jgi:hypothetical protein
MAGADLACWVNHNSGFTQANRGARLFTSDLPQVIVPQSIASMRQPWRRVAGITAPPAYEKFITRITMARLFWILMAITLRRFVTPRSRAPIGYFDFSEYRQRDSDESPEKNNVLSI